MNISTVNVIVVKNGVVEEVHSFADNEKGNELAEEVFLDICRLYVSNWDVYTREDKDHCLEDGTCLTGVGSICIAHSEGDSQPFLLGDNDAALIIREETGVEVHIPTADEDGTPPLTGLVIAGVAMRLGEKDFTRSLLASLDDEVAKLREQAGEHPETV